MYKLVPICACAAALVACAPDKQTAAKRPATRARPSASANIDEPGTSVDQLPPAVQASADAHRNGSVIKTRRVQNSRRGRIYTVRLRDGRELEIAADGALINARPEFADTESNDDSRHP